MSQIIKKQIRRSMPVILIFLLINISLYGLVFNLEFNLHGRTASVFDWLKDAKADTATSTVTVRNAPPAFSANAAENPTSSSTAPVNVGASIGYTGTADDPEDNSYYLIVCDSDSVTAGVGGGAPTCGGTQFCVSGLVADTVQASCTYNNVADPSAETDAWYAFVCDNHATQAECSSSNQGSGDPGSPIYINHASTFTAVSTTLDNRNPGQDFTVQVSSTDADVQGGADYMVMSVCSTDAWSATTGCTATTYCTATSSNPTTSCNYTSPVPSAHGAITYYAFVKDWHNMAATGNSRTSSMNVNNVAPTVGTITFNNSAVINLNMKNEAGKVVWATSTSVTDNNGCNDLVDATSTVFMTGASGAQYCSANDNNCYWDVAANCSISDCAGGSDTIATVACYGSLAFHATPTDAAGDNPYAGYEWQASINAYDETLTGSATSSGVELIAGPALSVSEATVPYGILIAGQNSGAVNATTTVVNWGNTPLDSDLEGTWMAQGANHIGEEYQHFNLAAFTYPAGSSISSTTPVSVDVVVARPTNGTDVTDEIYWGIGIPVGTPSGDYEGMNTFTAALDALGGVWN